MQNNNQGSSKVAVSVIAAVVVVIIAIMLMSDRNSDVVQDPTVTPSVSASATPTAVVSPSASASPAVSVKTFNVSGKPFSFSPAEMKVKKGDTVKIIFKNEQGMHDLVVDGYNARTKVLQVGQSETIQFVADKTGTFEYYCSVGTHRQQGMKGKLIVE